MGGSALAFTPSCLLSLGVTSLGGGETQHRSQPQTEASTEKQDFWLIPEPWKLHRDTRSPLRYSSARPASTPFYHVSPNMSSSS